MFATCCLCGDKFKPGEVAFHHRFDPEARPFHLECEAMTVKLWGSTPERLRELRAKKEV